MPIVAEGAGSKKAGRGVQCRLLLLLLAGPALLLILLLAVGVAGPLQLGPAVLVSEIFRVPGMSEGVEFSAVEEGSDPELRGHSYRVTGSGVGAGFFVRGWGYVCGWFPGHRLPDERDDPGPIGPAPTPSPAAAGHTTPPGAPQPPGAAPPPKANDRYP